MQQKTKIVYLFCLFHNSLLADLLKSTPRTSLKIKQHESSSSERVMVRLKVKRGDFLDTDILLGKLTSETPWKVGKTRTETTMEGQILQYCQAQVLH